MVLRKLISSGSCGWDWSPESGSLAGNWDVLVPGVGGMLGNDTVC